MAKECYVKCASNEQAQALRPYLVEVGFVDDKEWNDYSNYEANDCIDIGSIGNAVCLLLDEDTEKECGTLLLHTVPADADLAEAAKTIKELFDKL